MADLSSIANVTVLIDSNDNTSTAYFRVYHDSETSSKCLLHVGENGTFKLGDISDPDFEVTPSQKVVKLLNSSWELTCESDLYLRSDGHIGFVIDADDTSTTRVFRVFKDGTSASDCLLQVGEDRAFSLGDYSSPTFKLDWSSREVTYDVGAWTFAFQDDLVFHDRSSGEDQIRYAFGTTRSITLKQGNWAIDADSGSLAMSVPAGSTFKVSLGTSYSMKFDGGDLFVGDSDDKVVREGSLDDTDDQSPGGNLVGCKAQSSGNISLAAGTLSSQLATIVSELDSLDQRVTALEP
jgi:hypothetical protein